MEFIIKPEISQITGDICVVFQSFIITILTKKTRLLCEGYKSNKSKFNNEFRGFLIKEVYMGLL